MDLIQINGQPRFGRFSELPSAITVSKYVYKTPYGKTLKSWRKKLKFKKFKYDKDQLIGNYARKKITICNKFI